MVCGIKVTVYWHHQNWWLIVSKLVVCEHCQNWWCIYTVKFMVYRHLQTWWFVDTVRIDGLLTLSKCMVLTTLSRLMVYWHRPSLCPPPPHHPSLELYAGNLPGLTHSSFLVAQSESNITLNGSFLMQDHFGANIVAWCICSLPRIMILAIPSPEGLLQNLFRD